MSRSRVMALTASFLSQAGRSAPLLSSPAQSPAHLRFAHNHVTAGACCIATRAASTKADNSMTKQDLVDSMVKAEMFPTKAAASEAISAITETIMDQVTAGNTIKLTGFGTFANRAKPARKGRNPATGAELDLPPSNSPAFTAGKTFKDWVKAGRRVEPKPAKRAGRKPKSPPADSS